MRRLADLSPEIQGNIKKLYADGMSIGEISRRMNIHLHAVNKLCVNSTSDPDRQRKAASVYGLKRFSGLTRLKTQVDSEWDSA